MRLYQSLRGDYNDKDPKARVFLAHEAPVLAGYTCGNTPQIGCLTNDITVRLHSCEKGMHCSRITDKTVWIRPIIARNKFGVEIGEIGVGGGGGDLTQHPELELDDSDVIEQLLNL
jgi:DNA cross-link repair 1C protein